LFLGTSAVFLEDFNHNFLVIDVYEMSTFLPNKNLPDYKLSSVAQYFGIEECESECEMVMNVFALLWEERSFTFTPYIRV
jgi:hypothetical protein